MRYVVTALLLLVSLNSFAHQDRFNPIEDDFHFEDPPGENDPVTCTPASLAQIAQLNLGNQKHEKFLERCLLDTAKMPNGEKWCAEIIRPNPLNEKAFQCVYGTTQPYLLIHPNESTWRHAINAIKLVQQIEASGICVLEIYNWWRPEPYNKTVGGAPLRHPGGTSVDVRLCEKDDQENAFLLMCKARRSGKIRALGYYPTTALHLGVGDARANTWGKTCPRR